MAALRLEIKTSPDLFGAESSKYAGAEDDGSKGKGGTPGAGGDDHHSSADRLVPDLFRGPLPDQTLFEVRLIHQGLIQQGFFCGLRTGKRCLSSKIALTMKESRTAQSLEII